MANSPALPCAHSLQEHVLEPASRRKLSVRIEGHRPADAAAPGAGAAAPAAEGTGGAAAAGAGQGAPEGGETAAAGEAAAPAAGADLAPAAPGPEVERIALNDMWEWKRRQALYGAAR